MVQVRSGHISHRISAAEADDGDTGHLVCPVFVERLPAAEPDTDRQEGIYPSGSDGAVQGTYSNQMDLLLAGLVMSIIPIIILYIALQKYIIAGVVAGAVKS